MSIDLDWAKLDSSLAMTLVDMLNRQLESTSRPSFIGPVQVTSIEFGSTSPDVELVDMRDIYRDFLEDDEEEEEEDPVKVTENKDDDDDAFEWVSRRAMHKMQTSDLYPSSSVPSLHSNPVPGYLGYQSMVDFRPGPPIWPYIPTTQNSPASAPPRLASEYSPKIPSSPNPPEAKPEIPPSEPQNLPPNLQMHFNINWNSDLRITLTTSLLINYPSPMFMSLPIKLSVTGLIFSGQVAVAYEGERRRVHLCVLDELDPYAPTSRREPTSPELEDDQMRRAKALPIGQRLLPSIFIESEIGQADKHVLKNVTRVERFIQDVIRKTVEEEVVFPNFFTLVMPEPQPPT
ncbi:hypothetical protein CYLTODRAFT_391015 [Cylindrobasidium torrendii FP15055 ss-10]|uniref:Mitochondrial distribution and morphology protein 12 n=1 Tax=Cylindrobasidium torrendii FP15055 ss-10 TaxID=1314674 RepID=A0A0D7BLD2_9AGAR|nr:hypothetical protein CYLTODRAFT_391015 [Cylindrobasidium torrendii FP15055 ss-10]